MILMCFAEGIIAFISPCMLPMIPLYISYLGNKEVGNKKKLIINTLGFILGFTIIFTLLGVAATSIGTFIQKYKYIFRYISSTIIILFGLSYIIPMNFLAKERKIHKKIEINNIFSSILFGIIFSIGWTPCVGPLLASALIQASNMETIYSGVLLLISFSLGLGIPFFITTIIYDELVDKIKYLKKNFKWIKIISGVVLISIGIIMILAY